MQVNLIKSIISSFAGTNASGIVDLLYEKKNVNEFLIAKKLSLTINQTRNILYKLADEGLVSFIRKKDSKKGGWYTYFWTLNSGKSLIRFKEGLEKNLESLRERIKSRKHEQFYSCKNCSTEFGEEQALLHAYSCPECGEVVEQKDMSVEVQDIEREIIKLEQALIKVSEELREITDKENKSRSRRLKAEEKRKKKERATRQKIARRLRNKEKKKKTKRIVRSKSKSGKRKRL